MKTKAELLANASEIRDLIKTKIVTPDPELLSIPDGIIDIEKYYNAKFRILWILKEPYDEIDENNKPFGGGWDLNEVIQKKANFTEFTAGRKTFKPMIYVSYGILNDFCLWNNMDDVEKNPTMIDSLKSTSYINIKKLPGHTTSYKTTIEHAYQEHREIILKQINYYEPNIIIGGSTLYMLLNDLGIDRKNMITYKSLKYFLKGTQIFIDAYHPAQRTSITGITEENYCDDIISIVRQLTLSKN